MNGPKIATIGGILSHTPGYGFKLTFKTETQAQKYKEMMIFILRDDNFQIIQNRGYYDKKEYD